MADSLKDKIASFFLGQPKAYSRITRTPIYEGEGVPGAGAEYHSSALLPGYISTPDLNNTTSQVLRHEQGHAIYDQAGLAKLASSLAAIVPQSTKDFLGSNSLYNTSDPRRVSDEGLGFAIGNENDTPYINAVASQISDPTLRSKLLRLHLGK